MITKGAKQYLQVLLWTPYLEIIPEGEKQPTNQPSKQTPWREPWEILQKETNETSTEQDDECKTSAWAT